MRVFIYTKYYNSTKPSMCPLLHCEVCVCFEHANKF